MFPVYIRNELVFFSGRLGLLPGFFLTVSFFIGCRRRRAGLDGVELIVNGSGSYFELRKANVAVDLVRQASAMSGGCYLYSNLRGCDGQRVLFNGGSCVALNGHIVARCRQFSYEEVVRLRRRRRRRRRPTAFPFLHSTTNSL